MPLAAQFNDRFSCALNSPGEHTATAESERLEALRRYRLLDTPPEPEYDDITRLASQICSTPIALVSLVDESRQWFKSRVGIDAQETPRNIAFCDHAIRDNALFEVADASEDSRFSDNPLVTEDPNIRFYAGMPLTSESGHNVGTLCVIDTIPRRLSPEQKIALTALARQVVLQFELRQSLAQEQALRAELATAFEERSKSEQEQRKAKQFLRGVLDSLRDHIAIVDVRGTIIDTNRSWRNFAADNIGSSSLMSVGAGANYLEVCDRAVSSGAPEAAEVAEALRLVLKSGNDAGFAIEYPCHSAARQRWFVVRISPLTDGDDRFAVVSHQNITARKLAENNVNKLNDTLEERVALRNLQLEKAFRELRESELKFRAMFDGAAVGLALIDRDSRLEQSNTAYDELIGVERGAYIGKSLLDLIEIGDKKTIARQRDQLIAGESAGAVQDLRLRRPDGSTVWLNTSAIAIRDADGNYRNTLVVAQNVTPRKLAEYERDQFFEQSADMFAIIDFDGVITRVNHACSSVLDYEPEDLVGTRYLDLVAERQHPIVEEIFRRLVSGEVLDISYLDLDMVLKRGGERVVRWTVAYWHAEQRLMAVGRDMTEVLDNERALKALAARLHQIREDERSRISREIHDHLGQMITALKMDLTLLHRDTAAQAPIALADIESTLKLVDDTLQAVRGIAQELRPEVLDALGLIPAIEWQAREFEERSGLKLHVESGPIPEITEKQSTELFRIAQEALTNIARHAHAKTVLISIMEQAGGVEMTIRDDGVGFDYQKTRAGVSLGMLGMRERASSIDALLNVISAPGEGTLISVRLPLNGIVNP